MKIYLVGGAVRDHLLGLPVKERDWVVVGATVDDMLKLGYRQVGKEFPVFLHPKTREEYALARMERKVSPGYTGFTFDASPLVTLEDDLLRRDLTINAMAETPEGELVDPYHGKDDLKHKRLRHVSPAFAEDPVRILRVGRLLARYYHLGFQVAPETLKLMTGMVAAGEVDALVAERVWKELERALSEKNPEQFFIILATCGALEKLFPEMDVNSRGMKALIATEQLTKEPIIRFAALLHDQEDAKHSIAAISNRYRLPNDYRELAILTALHYKTALQTKNLSAEELIQLFSALDIYRRSERFSHFMLACRGVALAYQQPFEHTWLIECAIVAKGYDVQELIAAGLIGNELAIKLKEMRTKTVAAWLSRS